MGLFSENKERKMQLYFRDDNKFQFIPRQLEYSCLVEKDGGQIKKGWKHFYATELPFAGYGKIHSAMVTLGFPRDIILDLFDRIPEGTGISQKPRTVGESIKNWIAKIAESQRHIFRTKRQTAFLTNKIIWAEIFVIVAMVFMWGFRFLTR